MNKNRGFALKNEAIFKGGPRYEKGIIYRTDSVCAIYGYYAHRSRFEAMCEKSG